MLFPDQDTHGEPDEIGECDYCTETHWVFSINDHCVECGNCFTHCVCKPKANARAQVKANRALCRG